MTLSNPAAHGVGDEGLNYDETLLPPLVKQKTFRVTAPMYARVTLRALCEGKSEGEIIRRWLTKGALTEGISLNLPL